jgi:branched-chain amino acid transport system substrate-binding protein
MSGGLSFRRGVTRRGFLTVAVSAIVAGVVAGVGAYYAGTLSAPAAVTREVTKTIERTTTATVTKTVTVTTATPTAPATTAPRAEKEVIIGQVTSLTGMFSGFGYGYYWGVQKAVEDINKLGGLKVGDKRLPVRVVVYDDESDPGKAASLTTKLILVDNVVAVIGHGVPSLAIPEGTVCDRYKVPLIHGSTPFEPWYEGAKGTKYDWCLSFRIGTPVPEGDPRHGKVGYTIADSLFHFTDMFADQTNRKVAVLASGDADGTGWYAVFSKLLKESGRYDPYRVDENFGLYPLGTTDFSSIILEWKAAKCQILWANLPAPDFGIFWRQAHSLGWVPKLAWIGRASMVYEDVVAWGGDLPWGIADEDFWNPCYPFPGIGGRTSASLADEWYKEKGTPVNTAVGFGGYRCAQVLFAAIEKAGSLDPQAINGAFLDLETTSLCGYEKFIPETHDSPCAINLIQWVKTDKPWVWERQIVWAALPEIPVTTKPIFPLPGCTFT